MALTGERIISVTDERTNMIDRRHFRRLEHIYASNPAEAHEMNRVAVALGRAELTSTIEEEELSPQTLASHSHYHQLLCDAAALAAGSLIEDRLVAAEEFDMQIEEPGYSGAVVVSAQVALAEPPHFHVQAQLRTPDGKLLARGFGRFAKSTRELPPDPQPDAESAEAPQRDPAVYASVWTSPFGVVHLN
jgi:hypothetical protein